MAPETVNIISMVANVLMAVAAVGGVVGLIFWKRQPTWQHARDAAAEAYGAHVAWMWAMGQAIAAMREVKKVLDRSRDADNLCVGHDEAHAGGRGHGAGVRETRRCHFRCCRNMGDRRRRTLPPCQSTGERFSTGVREGSRLGGQLPTERGRRRLLRWPPMGRPHPRASWRQAARNGHRAGRGCNRPVGNEGRRYHPAKLVDGESLEKGRGRLRAPAGRAGESGSARLAAGLAHLNSAISRLDARTACAAHRPREGRSQSLQRGRRPRPAATASTRRFVTLCHAVAQPVVASGREGSAGSRHLARLAHPRARSALSSRRRRLAGSGSAIRRRGARGEATLPTPRRREPMVRAKGEGVLASVRDGLSDGHVREAAEPVGADGEHSSEAGEPACAGLAVARHEVAVAQERLEARPEAARGDARAQTAAGRVSRWLAPPGLAQDRPAPEDRDAGARSRGGEVVLDERDAFTQDPANLGGVAQLGGMTSSRVTSGGIGPASRKK